MPRPENPVRPSAWRIVSLNRRTFLNRTGAALTAVTLSSPHPRPAHAAGAKPKTILLHSAWATKNIGDIGHTPGTLRIVEQHLPDVRVVLWAANVNEPVEAMLRRRFPKLEIVQGSLGKDGPSTPALRDAIAGADLFVRNSGMGQDTAFMSYCRAIGKPYGLYGQSYFPAFVEGDEAASHIDLLNRAAFVYCRDGRTLATLRRAGVSPPVLEFAPDGCFGIDVRDEARALAFMKGAGLEDRKFITIQLRTNTASAPGVDDRRTPKLNPLHPTPEQVADDERRAAVYRELITAWIERTGHKVLIAPEVQKEMEHNRRLLHDPLPARIRKHVVNRETFWNADEAASVFARAHTAICHEPHSLIIALANGTPILHTYSEFHSPKCWMFEDIGLPEWLLEFDSTPAETLIRALFAIDADYPGAQAKVGKAMDFVHRRQAESMRVIGELLDAT